MVPDVGCWMLPDDVRYYVNFKNTALPKMGDSALGPDPDETCSTNTVDRIPQKRVVILI